MVEIIRAPQPLPESGRALFLAGGISGCPPWQTEACAALEAAPPAGLELVFDPRRERWPEAESEARAQIEWEFHALRRSEAILFWFPEETLCPITLFELGAWSRGDGRLVVGCHPGYARRFDVIEQLRLARPDVRVQARLEDVLAELSAR